MALEIRRVTVIGAGLMGHGIAQVCAQTAGYDVTLLDVKQEFVDRGISMVRDSLAKFVAKGSLDKAKSEEILSRIHPAPWTSGPPSRGRSLSSRPPRRTPSSSSTSTAGSRSTSRGTPYSPPTPPRSA